MDPVENNTASNPNSTGAANVSATGSTSPKEEVNTLMAVLSYLGVLVLIPYLTTKNDPFVKFHIKQGVVLAGGELVAYVLIHVMPFLFPIAFLLYFTCIILSIVGIVNVLQGKEKELPLAGGFAHKVNI